MKHIPIRSCIVCREQKNKSELLRLVLRPDGTVVADVTGREPGRGAYVCKSEECVSALTKKQALAKTYRRSFARETYDALDAELREIISADDHE